MKILSTKRLVKFSALAEGDSFLYDGNLLIKADPIVREDMGDDMGIKENIPCAVNLKNGRHWIFMEDVMVERAHVHIEDD